MKHGPFSLALYGGLPQEKQRSRHHDLQIFTFGLAPPPCGRFPFLLPRLPFLPSRVPRERTTCHVFQIGSASSLFARLRTPVTKPGRSEIKNFLMNCKIPNFVMNHQRHTKVIVKKQKVTGYDSRCGYDGAGSFRDPELEKDEPPSMSPEACHTFPYFCSRFFNVDVLYRIRGFPWRSNSDEICFSNRLCVLCSLFLPIHVTAHCRQQCPSRSPCQECKA